jgi:hypothetical protein
MDALDLRQEPENEERPITRNGCLAVGCPCKDVRIVSRRRAMFYAYLAQNRGETANRVIEPEPEWALPVSA